MAVLSANAANFITGVRDKLLYGQNHGTRASATLSATHVVVGQRLVVQASDFGTAPNAYTVVITLPGGTSGLSVTFLSGVLTINLAVTAGVATAGANTLNAIATAILGLSGSPFIAYPDGTGLGEIRAAAGSAPFAGGTAGRVGVPAAPAPFMLAQDCATVLQLLQNQLVTGTVTATAGSTTTATVTTATLANDWRGALVTFASNTTTVALRGVTARVLSNTTTILTFSSTLPAAVANTDTFTMRHDFMDAAILELRQGRTQLNAPPAGNVYGLNRTVVDAFGRLITTLGGTIFTPTMSWTSATVGTGSTTSNIVVNQTYKIDELKNKNITISGVTRKIVSNTESTIQVSPAFAAAPVSTTAYTVTVPVVTSWDNAHVYPGPHQWNYMLGSLITVALTEVVAVVLPT